MINNEWYVNQISGGEIFALRFFRGKLYALDNKICKINGNSFSHYGYFPILPFVNLICFMIAFRGFFLGLQFNILSNSSSKLMESVKALI